MKNTTELRTELTKVFQELRNNKINLKTAKAIVATSNTILKSAALELEQNKFTDNKKQVEFLETTNEKDLQKL